MALPAGFTQTEEYFRALVEVLYKFRWLYMYPNTDLFKSKVLDSFPIDWCNWFQCADDNLGNLGLGIEILNAPQSLNNFIKTINSLTPTYELKTQPINLQLETLQSSKGSKGLSIKKQHEISLLTPLIQNIVEENQIDYVIDMGCGLGYLTNILHENQINILGIDGNDTLISTAKTKYPQVPFEHLFLTIDSAQELTLLLKKNFPEFDENVHRVCLVALHACADLTVDMLKLSVLINCLKTAIVMPCCYHRMKQKEIEEEQEGINKIPAGYFNFPLSNELKTVLRQLESGFFEDFLNGTFLRLACQRANWKINQSKEQWDIQTNNLLFRNLLQLVADEENLHLQRRRRKTGSNRGDYNIDSFLTNLSTSYDFSFVSTSSSHTANVTETPITDETFSRVKTRVKQHFETYSLQKSTLAAYIALQNLIQPVCENLVLLDRCCYMRERANTRCVTLKVTDECISPRCFALVVTKQQTTTKLSTQN